MNKLSYKFKISKCKWFHEIEISVIYVTCNFLLTFCSVSNKYVIFDGLLNKS